MSVRKLASWTSACALALSSGVTARAQTTSRASLAPSAEGNGNSYVPVVSADGRYVAFESFASNLVLGDANGAYDVFVRDRVHGTTVRVSLDSAEVGGDNASVHPAISADGRFVAFEAGATNLVPGDTNGASDIFVRDRVAGTTERVSVDSAGLQASGQSYRPAISADGRFVAFHSLAPNLVAGDANGKYDVFVRDRVAGTTELVSVDSGGADADGDSSSPAITPDGRYVAFHSYASDLVAGDTNAKADVFVRDRVLAATVRVSLGPGATEANGHSTETAISDDARYVAFQSDATDLVAGDTNGTRDVFVVDRTLGTTERASVDSSAAEGDSFSFSPSISGDGRFVVFESYDTNLVAGDTNGQVDVFLRDRTLGTTERVSVASGGGQADLASRLPSISGDARFVVFESTATNLVPGDANGRSDVFVRDRDETGALAFCFPEIGGVRSCPCGNPATAADLGCDSFVTASTASGTGGAKLTASGVPNASLANTLVFHVTKAHNPGSNSNLHVFWKGTSTLAVGVKSGFGVRCVAGTLKRIYQGSGAGTGGLGSTNAVDFPNGTQTTNAWTASQTPAAGTTLYYYDSFRDQQGPTTCNTANDRFNVSHAVALTWVP